MAVQPLAGAQMTDTSLISARRYTPVAQALHWITAVLVFLTIPLAWVMVNMPSTAHISGELFTLHESIGLTILIIVAVRLIWRARHPAPPLPGHFARWDRLASRASHWLLYAILIGMPISGYLMNAAGGYPIGFFWLFNMPGLPKMESVSDFGFRLHVVIGQWLLYALVILHVAATAWHVFIRKDGTLQRMLPEQNT
jgi:cytochrome b561